MPELDYNDLVNVHSFVQQIFGISAGVRDESTLHAVENRPNQMFYGNTPFPDIFTKTASMMEAIIRWHPFVDANKRTALAVASLYLYVNGYSFVLALSAVRFSVQIALADTKDQSGREDQEKLTQLTMKIAKWLRKYSAPSQTPMLRMKYRFYVTFPLRLIRYALETPLVRNWAYEVISRWLALDIYPEYAKDTRQMLSFLAELTSAALPRTP
jgi:death-on-curing protein